MPKATKLHVKGKSNTLQKPCKVEKDGAEVDPEESIRQFQLELCWCIQQLERSLREKKGNEKQMQETWKVLTVLKNNNQPIIRKRQLMRTHFGDYRAKMAAEEKKLAKMASKIKISDVPDKPKATFLRKSAFLTTGDNSFRFNFSLVEQPEQADNSNSVTDTGTTDEKTEVGNTDAKLDFKVDKVDSNNDKLDSKNDKLDSKHDKVDFKDGKVDSKNDKVDSKNDIVDSKDNKNFKFSFTGSEFKFNFNVDS